MSNGWSFLDNWNNFYSRNIMSARDGVAALADSLERRIREYRECFHEGTV